MKHTELYDRLGIGPQAGEKMIKEAYRRAVKTAHPDAGGVMPEEFFRITEAYEILSDPEKRKRYDETGRTDENKITESRIREFINSTIQNVVNAERPDGSTDDPTWEDIRNKVILSLHEARNMISKNLKKSEKKHRRAQILLSRFKKRTGTDQAFDPVGDAIRDQIKRLEEEINTHADALALSEAVEEVLNDYLYEVGVWPSEGQYDNQTPSRSRGSGILFVRDSR